MVTLPQSLRSHPPGARGRAWRILAVVLAAVILLAFLWSLGAEQRAIGRMDPVERRAVYEQAFGELQRLCGSGPRDDVLEKRCVEQIQFISQFPECDARCQEIARSHTPRPTK
jgi:hypothetical protein